MQKGRINPIELLWLVDPEFRLKIERVRKDYDIKPNEFSKPLEFDITLNLKWEWSKKHLFFNDLYPIVYEYKLYGYEKELQY